MDTYKQNMPTPTSRSKETNESTMVYGPTVKKPYVVSFSRSGIVSSGPVESKETTPCMMPQTMERINESNVKALFQQVSQEKKRQTKLANGTLNIDHLICNKPNEILAAAALNQPAEYTPSPRMVNTIRLWSFNQMILFGVVNAFQPIWTHIFEPFNFVLYEGHNPTSAATMTVMVYAVVTFLCGWFYSFIIRKKQISSKNPTNSIYHKFTWLVRFSIATGSHLIACIFFSFAILGRNFPTGGFVCFFLGIVFLGLGNAWWQSCGMGLCGMCNDKGNLMTTYAVFAAVAGVPPLIVMVSLFFILGGLYGHLPPTDPNRIDGEFRISVITAEICFALYFVLNCVCYASYFTVIKNESYVMVRLLFETDDTKTEKDLVELQDWYERTGRVEKSRLLIEGDYYGAFDSNRTSSLSPTESNKSIHSTDSLYMPSKASDVEEGLEHDTHKHDTIARTNGNPSNIKAQKDSRNDTQKDSRNRMKNRNQMDKNEKSLHVNQNVNPSVIISHELLSYDPTSDNKTSDTQNTTHHNETEESEKSARTTIELLKEVWPILVGVFITYFGSFCFFPTALVIQSISGVGNWPVPVVRMITVTLWGFVDPLGRILADWYPLVWVDKKGMLVIGCIRCLLWVVILTMVFQFTVPYYVPMLISALGSLTDGYILTLSVVKVNLGITNQSERAQTGPWVGNMIMTGIMMGAILNFLWVGAVMP